MIYKTTSYKQVVTKVQRDFNLTGSNWIPAAIEWIGEALGEIGTHAHLERLSCELTSYNHRIPLPCNHESTLAVEYYGHNLNKGGSLRYGKFGNNTLYKTYNEEAFPLPDLETNEIDYQEVLPGFSTAGAYYLENPDYIITSFECGPIILHYQGYKLDEDGFPVVPDSSEHREALAFYILYKYLSRGNKHTVWNVADARAEWIRYKCKAQNAYKMPDIQDLERFTNMWSRIVRDNFAGDKFFEGTEQKDYNFGI